MIMVKEHDAILAKLMEAVRTSPGDAEAHFRLGDVLFWKR
jgi:cytochrome c-type biogenesis protein CcmH/NrfG